MFPRPGAAHSDFIKTASLSLSLFSRSVVGDPRGGGAHRFDVAPLTVGERTRRIAAGKRGERIDLAFRPTKIERGGSHPVFRGGGPPSPHCIRFLGPVSKEYVSHGVVGATEAIAYGLRAEGSAEIPKGHRLSAHPGHSLRSGRKADHDCSFTRSHSPPGGKVANSRFSRVQLVADSQWGGSARVNAAAGVGQNASVANRARKACARVSTLRTDCLRSWLSNICLPM
jgi:hypothetical protein